MLEIVYRPKARGDLAHIANYSENLWGDARAKRYLQTLGQAIERAAKFPDIGAEVPEITEYIYRKLSSGSHRILYRVDGARFLVVRILHQKMDILSAMD